MSIDGEQLGARSVLEDAPHSLNVVAGSNSGCRWMFGENDLGLARRVLYSLGFFLRTCNAQHPFEFVDGTGPYV
jgi:hypothetical protein